ncbi:MAG: DNA repair protein RecN [Ruminococcus sp.]|nr:DNA repair protein RecN [Ruminococcus sp.]
MLNSLYIENIAVIEKTNIDFSQGLNALTGETGAGKSIIIDSINAVTGHRTSKDIIRTGAEKAFVAATFTNVNEEILNKASELGFESEDGSLIFSRELSLNGRSSCRINSRPATLAVLKELGINLINIHGQHESLELMQSESHINYIDNFAEISEVVADYYSSYKELKKLEKLLNTSKTDESRRLYEIDLLNFQVDEINNAALEIGEDEALEDERRLLENGEKIVSLLKKATSTLSGYGEGNACDLVDEASSYLIKASALYEEADDVSNRLADLSYTLQDISAEISGMVDELDLNPLRLDEVEERLDEIYKLKRKYGSTIEEILEFRDEADQKLAELQNYDANMANAKQEYEKLLKLTNKKAENLTKLRYKSGEEFSKRVQTEMKFLDMPNVRIFVSIEETPLSPKGKDKVEILISANPGETPKPVTKIASGGELSRMMLAIKTVLSESDTIDTLIFDEVDTGISGKAAMKVGMKLREVAKNRQVLCVTHQVQIASLAENHFLIRKNFKEDRTFTDVISLDREGRINELSRIMGGIEITENTRKLAAEMLDNN